MLSNCPKKDSLHCRQPGVRVSNSRYLHPRAHQWCSFWASSHPAEHLVALRSTTDQHALATALHSTGLLDITEKLGAHPSISHPPPAAGTGPYVSQAAGLPYGLPPLPSPSPNPQAEVNTPPFYLPCFSTCPPARLTCTLSTRSAAYQSGFSFL